MSSKLQATPSEDSQSDCYYPSCDIATPPLVPVHPGKLSVVRRGSGLICMGMVFKVVCQLESSGKWPDEVQAIQKIKMAFYVHIARALKEQRKILASPTPHHLDILKVRPHT